MTNKAENYLEFTDKFCKESDRRTQRTLAIFREFGSF